MITLAPQPTINDSLTIYTASLRSGDDVTVTITLDLPVGVHIEPVAPTHPEAIATRLSADGLEDQQWTEPDTVTKDLGFDHDTLTVLEGAVEFTVSGTLTSDTDQLTGTLTFQPCIRDACLQPRTIVWHAPIDSVGGYSVLGALGA